MFKLVMLGAAVLQVAVLQQGRMQRFEGMDRYEIKAAQMDRRSVNEGEYSTYNFQHPLYERILQGGVPINQAKVVIISVHGKGGNAPKMLMLASKVVTDENDITYLAPQAKARSWFDGDDVSDVETVNAGLADSVNALEALIDDLRQKGVPSSKIVLVGHSQGSVLVNEFVATQNVPLRGMVSTSGGLIAGAVAGYNMNQRYHADVSGMTIRLGCHHEDPKIPLEMPLRSAEYYRSKGANVELNVAPDYGHGITQNDLIELISVTNYDRDDRSYSVIRLAGGGSATAVIDRHRNNPAKSLILVKVFDAEGRVARDIQRIEANDPSDLILSPNVQGFTLGYANAGNNPVTVNFNTQGDRI